MPDATDVYGTVFLNGSATFLARVLNPVDGTELQVDDVDSIAYSVYELDDQDATSRDVVTGHNEAPLDVEDVMFDVLQVDALWTKDDDGYNFKHVLDVSVSQAFTTVGARYLVEHVLTPSGSGDQYQDIIVRFEVRCI